jgi:hypothetical protein
MTKNLLIALGLALCSTLAAAAQDRAPPSGSTPSNSPPSTTPSGTQPATPATPADPGTSPATPATPATPGKAQGKGQGFAKLDSDHDGSLSESELKADASITASFSELDADHNGKLTSAEFAAFEKK